MLKAKDISIGSVFLLASESKDDLVKCLNILGYSATTGAISVSKVTTHGNTTVYESPDLYSPDISLADLLLEIKDFGSVFPGNPNLDINSFYVKHEGLSFYS